MSTLQFLNFVLGQPRVLQETQRNILGYFVSVENKATSVRDQANNLSFNVTLHYLLLDNITYLQGVGGGGCWNKRQVLCKNQFGIVRMAVVPSDSSVRGIVQCPRAISPHL